jgi:hypothetical protein
MQHRHGAIELLLSGRAAGDGEVHLAEVACDVAPARIKAIEIFSIMIVSFLKESN